MDWSIDRPIGSSILGSLSILNERMRHCILKHVQKIKGADKTTCPPSAQGPSAKGELSWTPPLVYMAGREICIDFVLFLILNYIGAAIFKALEGWAYTDCLYHSVMTATTIGLGDISPQTEAGRAYGIIHMLLSVILFGKIISSILDIRTHAYRHTYMQVVACIYA